MRNLRAVSALAVFAGMAIPATFARFLRADVAAPALQAPIMLKGILVTPSGRPLPHVTLSFFDNPPSEPADWKSGLYNAVTDDQGRFVYKVAPGYESSATGSFPGDPNALDAEAVILDSGVPYDKGDYRACSCTFVRTGPSPEVKLVAPEVGYAAIAVSDPQGSPVAFHDVTLLSRLFNTGDQSGVGAAPARTDAEGCVTVRAFTPNVLHLQVLAPGVGFGSTGDFELKPGTTIEESMPPMIRLGELSGDVAPELHQPGAMVSYRFTGLSRDLPARTTPIDAQGRFTIKDAPPGECSVTVTGSSVKANDQYIIVTPGQQVASVHIQAQDANRVISTLQAGVILGGPRAQTQPSNGPTLTLQGQVTNEGGRPVADADVYAVYQAYDPSPNAWASRSPFPNFQKVSTRTDANGVYKFEALNCATATLVAHRDGFVPAEATATLVPQFYRPGLLQSAAKTVNIVLPKGGDKLVVHTTAGGKPISGALVQLSPTPTPVGRNRYNGIISAESPEGQLRELFTPQATTDAKGDAVFTELQPGLWDSGVVSSGKFNDLDTIREGDAARIHATHFTSGNAQAIDVRRGETTRFSLALVPIPTAAPLKVPPQPGENVKAQETQYSVYRGGGEQMGGGVTPDWNGGGTLYSAQPGLWRVESTDREPGLPIEDITIPSIAVGSAYIALSPALAHNQPRVIHPIHPTGATLRVHLVDPAGYPVRGAVLAYDSFIGGDFAGSTDSQGNLVLHDLPADIFLELEASDYRKKSFLNTQPNSLFYADNPEHADCREFPSQSVITHLGETTDVTLRAVDLQYAHIKVNLPAGEKPTDYSVNVDQGGFHYCWGFYDAKTAEFVAGPTLPGPATASLIKRVPSGTDVSNNQVVKVPFTVDSSAPPLVITPTAEQIARASAAIQPPRIQPTPVFAKVVLPDGKTPAWPARFSIMYESDSQPIDYTPTGTDGKPAAQNYLADPDEINAPKGLPKLAAWLPGEYGAVVQDYMPGKMNILVLPPSVSLRGAVTVHGQAISGRLSESSYEIRAECAGHGKMNDQLSVTLTTQSDGTFDLRGLTAGKYTLQAARDGIWLSKPLTISVAATAAATSPIVLDIPAPGAPVNLLLADSAGKMLAGAVVTLDIPAGPLTDSLWPKTLTADAAGNLLLDGLTAGVHHARIAGSSKIVAFNVPALSPQSPAQNVALAAPLRP